ncbi:MAG: UDP-N-acetylglucosamine--N-acetylmuramyl-(pentapeptide) pyrophosphoryl-undecaprenol N-acetylglucosamine transferase [Cloacibacterium normanense]
MSKKLKILMSGGGTGGHIFPAVAIAQEIQKRFPDAEFLFMGANGKMEMEKVPQAGFKIEGLNIAGFDRGNLLANINLPFKVISSLLKLEKSSKEFQPDFAVGTGGFASSALYSLQRNEEFLLLSKSRNSLPGKTNIFNAKKAKTVFTAYPNMEKFFHGTKTLFLGNPIRKNIITDIIDSDLAKEKLGLEKGKLTILSVGGSLGSRTLNNGWKENLNNVKEKDYQLIWQTGKLDYKNILEETKDIHSRNIQIVEFIKNMEMAYSAADVIVSRAGAIAISELAIAKKPVLLVPFPFAAEDHQTKKRSDFGRQKCC